MTTITHDATTITPLTVDGYDTVRASRNIIHAIIGRPDPDVTLQPANLRTGTLRLVFATATAAFAAANLHALAGRFVLADTDIPQANMTYVLAGSIESILDDETRTAWIVTVDYQEVTP